MSIFSIVSIKNISFLRIQTMNKSSNIRLKHSTKDTKKLKYKSVKSVVSQYIKGQIPSTQVLDKQKHSVGEKSAVITGSLKDPKEVCVAPSAAERSPKFVHPNIEHCAPDVLCLNFPSQQYVPTMPDHGDEKSVLTMELKELKRISVSNETQITKMLNKLNQLRLSISLLSEERQRLEHSREIRTIGLKLLNNMIMGKYEDGSSGRREQYEREKQIIEKILEQLARLEKVKMKLEYENIRNLYTIKELKKENAELEKINADLHKEFNSVER